MEYAYMVQRGANELMKPAIIKHGAGYTYAVSDHRMDNGYNDTAEYIFQKFISTYIHKMTVLRKHDAINEVKSEYPDIQDLIRATKNTAWIQKIYNIIHRSECDNRFRREKCVRIESDRYTAVLILSSPIQMPDGIISPMKFYLHDAKLQFSTMFGYILTESNGTFIAGEGSTAIYYIENKYGRAKDIIRNEALYAINGLLPERLVAALERCIDVMNMGMLSSSNATYLASEKSVIRKMCQILSNSRCNADLAVTIDDSVAALSQDIYNRTMATRRNFEAINLMIDVPNDSDIPLLDLSKKEKKYINDYCTDIMNYSNGAVIDLKDLLSKAKYTWLRFDLNGETTYWHAKVSDNTCRMWIIQKLRDFTIQIYVDLDNIDTYNVSSNFLESKKILGINDLDKLIFSRDEFNTISELCEYEPIDSINLIDSVLKLLVVMRDRPQRMRVIKCTEKKRVQKDLNDKKKGYVEKEFVIHRILKSAPAAKEYIREMSAVTGERHYEYTLEEWDRRGHTRTLKSGKVIEIGATTCHRRKQLAGKEIHIKL